MARRSGVLLRNEILVHLPARFPLHYEDVLRQDMLLKMNYDNVMHVPRLSELKLQSKAPEIAKIAMEISGGQKFLTHKNKDLTAKGFRGANVVSHRARQTTLRRFGMSNFVVRSLTVMSLLSSPVQIRKNFIQFSMETEFIESSPELEDHFEIFELIKGFNVTVVTWAGSKEEASLLWSGFLQKDEVRNGACLCVQDTLQSFQGTPLLGPASKTIADSLMNKHPPPIDTTVPDVGVCKRNNAMYTMYVVKECLGLMSTEDRAALLVYFKILLELPPSYVSSLITGALYKLCLSPSLPAELSPEFLLDLVCSICLSVSQHKTGFAMKTMAGLLSSGVPKVYSFNKQMCEIKLPIVFDALIVLLEQSELQNFLDTGHAFSCLIAYIDESLIKPGVDRTLMHANRDVGSQSVPTLIEKLCASFPKLLHSYRSTDHWYLVLELVSTMIDKLGIHVKTLADIHKLPDKGFSFQEEVKPLLEKFVEKCGLDAITAVIPHEHIQLLPEINDQLGSKSVEAKAAISGHNLYQSKSRNNDPVEQCRYSKRKMNDRESMSRRQNRAALATLVKGKAKHALRGGVLGAV